MRRVDLEAECFITYEGIASDGHWNPGGADTEDAQGVISEFRKMPVVAALSALAHQTVVDFDLRSLEALGKDVYKGAGYFPQLAWMALERSGIWSAMNELADKTEVIRLSGHVDRAGLLLPSGVFKMAAELAAKGQGIDWDYRTEECGGHNLLFLYADNIVSKIYPTYSPRKDELLVESFVFDPALVKQT